MGINDRVVLQIGDILYDRSSKDIGLLVRRTNNHAYESCTDPFELWVWEVYWIHERSTHYTESGLINMIGCGLLVVYACI